MKLSRRPYNTAPSGPAHADFLFADAAPPGCVILARVRVVHVEPEPLHVLHYTAAPGRGTRTRALPLLRARVDGLPP